MPIARVGPDGPSPAEDAVAVEEPLEMILEWGPSAAREQRKLAITMRTPGADRNLAAGFLFAEGLITDRDQILDIHRCKELESPAEVRNTIRISLTEGVPVDLASVERSFLQNSACGVCGKTSLDALEIQGAPEIDPARPVVAPELIHTLPGKLRQGQAVFEQTGGLHAAALWTPGGDLVGLGEDVGRHNAVDKVIGEQFLLGGTPLSDTILTVSGRTSFEILQKALSAGIPIVIAVGAPSSLAVDLARRFDMTLVGFARDGRFNVYAGEQRIQAKR